MNWIQRNIAKWFSLDKRYTPTQSYLNWKYGASGDLSTEGVQGLAAWYRGTNAIATDIAGLHKNLFRKEGERRIKVEDHASIKLVTQQASRYTTSYSLFEYLIYSVLNKGNGYAAIGRDNDARPVELLQLHPDRVQIAVWEDGTIKYQVRGSKTSFYVDYMDMIHIKGVTLDGYSGIDPITHQKYLLGAALSSQKLNKEFYDNGTHLDGYIKKPGKFDPESAANLRKNWSDVYGGTGKSRVAVLDDGMEYQPISSTMADAQFIETLRHMNVQIAVILGLPPYMVGEYGEATWNNIEHQATNYVQQGLMQWVNKLEDEFNCKLLTEAEKKSGEYYWEFNVKTLLRGDSKTQAENQKTLFQTGSLTINEIRSQHGLNPIEDGDKTYIPLNMVALEDQDKYRKQGQQTAQRDGSEIT